MHASPTTIRHYVLHDVVLETFRNFVPELCIILSKREFIALKLTHIIIIRAGYIA